MKNIEWKGMGYCKARSIREYNDYCNDRTKDSSHEYCPHCTCSVLGCKGKSVVEWPLITGNPRLCSKHYHNPTPKFSTLVSKSNEPPDDFDIPY